jgi:uncharacterized protein (TIGR03437 family)
MKYCANGLLFVALILAGNAWCQGVITSFAGGPFIFNGNGQPAVNAPLGTIAAVTLDPSGNLVIADPGNGLVERINPDGTLSVIAGSGLTLGVHTGDGGPAVNAALNSVYGVAYDSSGNLYIAEADRLSRVSPQGIINTYAGGGSDATGNGIPALQASVLPVSFGGGLVVDATGAVYFAEAYNNRVRKVSPGGTIGTVAGTGAAEFSGDGGPAMAAGLNFPLGLALDRTGNLYIADNGNLRVRKVTPAGIISTVATSINATGLAFDNNGVFYIVGGGFVAKLTAGAATPVFIGGTPGSPGFSGDGGPALNAQFAALPSVVADTLGNLFIGDGDNDRVREISANGIVTTIAGNGQYYYTGEGVPALTSPVRGGGNLAIDKAGNVYYSDPLGSRVRKVSGGVINTVAGTGIAGFSGDGGPALNATLNNPLNLTFDSGGNLYIADYLNQRVRQVALNGAISTYAQLPGNVRGLVFDAAGNLYVSDESNSTVYRIDPTGKQTILAGTGSPGFSGDGGPANQAMLNLPSGLAMDTLGNLYIADAGNGCVRVVNSRGVISTLVSGGSNLRELTFDPAGNLYVSDESAHVVYKITPAVAVSIFAGGGLNEPGNGDLATKAFLVPYGIVADASGNIYIDDDDGIQEVLATPPTISLQQDSLSVRASSGGAPVTLDAGVLGSVPGLAFGVSATTATGGNWLSAGAASGNTPDLLSIIADPSNLTPGSYTGTITIVPFAATPAALTLTVTFTVGAALAPQLSVDQPNLSFTYPAGAPARSETLKISNAGGGGLPFIASAATKTGGSWLTVTPPLGDVFPGTPMPLTVTANPSNLPTGTYTGSVTIQSAGGGTVTLQVNMAISDLTQVLLLTQTGITFTGVAQGGVVPPQSFGVVNLGTGSVAWTATASTTSGGNWLSATPAAGSSDASLAAPQVTVNVNPTALTAGDYYGVVQITAPGAANTPQTVTVFLTVLPAGSDPGASVQPAELFFTATPGGGSPGAQEVLVYNVGAAAQTFYIGASSAQFNIAELPDVATLDPSHPTSVLLQPLASFPAGSFSDFMNFQFSDGRIQTVKVNVIAASSAVGSAAAASGTTGGLQPRDSSALCSPTKLIPALTSLSPAFAVSAGFPVALNVQSLDDCGNPQTSGNITVQFSTGDPPLALSSLNDGTWQATWATGRNDVGKPVTLTITAANSQLNLTGTTLVNGGLSSPKTPPTITQAGIVSGAAPVSFTALAPGSIISIYGNLLADDAVSAPSIPLPATLGNTSVIIGGQVSPLLFASPGQINAVVPFGLNTNTTYSLYIQRDLALSSAVPINIAGGQPGVFLNSSGIPYAYDSRGTAPPFLVTPSAPAQAGDVLVFYCAGLGPTNPVIGDGVASPASPTAQPTAPVMVTIGGQNANVLYAGLVAGLVGLYQVNVQVPTGVPPGNAVPVLLTVAGQTSPPATISTQ